MIELNVLSIDFDRLIVQVLHDPPDLFEVKDIWEFREKILQKLVSEGEQLGDLVGGVIDSGESFSKVLVLALVVDFLEDVADSCKRN